MASKQHTTIFDRLTDPKLYTGAHKHRFDESGNGRGLAGRDRISKGQGFIAGAPGGGVADLSQITRTNLHTTGAGYIRPPSPRGSAMGVSGGGGGGTLLYQLSSSAEAQGLALPWSPTGPSTPPARPASVGRSGLMRSSYSGGVPLTPTGTGTGSGTSMAGGAAAAAAAAARTRTSDAGERRTSIFDRLNDPSSYTGMHKNRFSADGRGRGAVGRTTPNAYVSPMDNVRR